MDIIVKEFYGFVGLLLFMDVLRSRKESVHDIRSAQKGFCRPVFAATMSRDSFVSVKGCSVHSSKFLLHEETMVSYIPKKNRNVIVLSSQHQGAVTEGEEHDFKPEMILDYNKTKRAVDTLDKLVREYRCLRTSRRWPPALFFDLIDIAGHNAFCAWSDHEPNYNVGKSHRRRLFLMQLSDDTMKPLIDGRARNPIGIQVPILADMRMVVPVEHRIARHIRPQENKTIERCAVYARGQDRNSRSKCDSCNNFICREHSEKKTVIVCDDCAAGAV